MPMVCRVVLIVLTVAYLGALFVYAAGAVGWSIFERNSLSGILLIILGLPWILFPLDAVLSEAYWPIVAIVAPIINLAISRFLCRRFSSSHGTSR